MSMMDDIFGGGQGGASSDLAQGYQNSINTYNQYLDKINTMFQPWMDRGNAAGDSMMGMGNEYQKQMESMMGNGPGGTGNWMTQYTASPWAQYQTDLGTQQANAAAAAGGMLGSGNNQRAVDTMSQGISSQDRQQYYNDMMELGSAATGNYDPLMQTGGQLTNALGGYTFKTGQAIGGAQQNIGQANAMGDMANSGMWNNVLGTASGLISPISGMFSPSLSNGGTMSSHVYSQGQNPNYNW